MTTRRQFLGTAITTAVLTPSLPAVDPAGPGLRAVYHWRNGQWVKCRLSQLRKGDVFSLDKICKCLAASDPFQSADGKWWVSAVFSPPPRVEGDPPAVALAT
jgi:hypothetical protein